MFDQPIITIFCAFTRLSMVERWLENLEQLDVDPERTNLAFIIDGASKDNEDPERDAKLIYQKLMAHMNRHQYLEFRIFRNEGHLVNEVSIPLRRQRIAEIKNQSKELIMSFQNPGEYVLATEDDTVFGNASFYELYQPFKMWPNVGMVSGFQAGRWFQKMLGVWQFDDFNDPTKCWTALPDADGWYEPIDAAGFYFYLTPTEQYMEHEYTTESWQPWGPDVNYGLWLRREGFMNVVDWDMPLGHEIETGEGNKIIQPDQGNLSFEYFIKGEHNEWYRVRQPGEN